MAYCVKCGVKLEEGARECPLCKTPVLLPPGLERGYSEPLFPQPLPPKGTEGITKTSKGIIELIVALLVVSEITIALTMWFSGNIEHSFVPLFSTAMGALVIAMALVAKHTYVAQATTHIVLVSLYLLGLDGTSTHLSWSLIAVGALLLLWVFAVFTTTKKAKAHHGWTALLLMASLLGYVAMINSIIAGNLTWFVPVALPTACVLFLGEGLFYFLFLTRKKNRLQLADLVFFNLIILFLTLTVLDIFMTHYRQGLWSLSWSLSLFSAAILLILLLVGVSASRRLRRYFTSQNRHR
ncbi:MAG: zinc ribbon domain-containing protein [Sphaerochaeta sp.]|nr:zinc ribbon domain-containing protein [Sphaerochaeta sp.]